MFGLCYIYAHVFVFVCNTQTVSNLATLPFPRLLELEIEAVEYYARSEYLLFF